MDWREWVCGALALVLAGVVPVSASAQRAATATSSLVFDHVTVIDVERGRRLPAQRVVIVGNRIKGVGDASAVQLPKGAQMVDAGGKYLIPGLWDMHVHIWNQINVDASIDDMSALAAIMYPLLLANGVTGIRDAGSRIPLDMLLHWRQEILAGTRLGPPRQILSGPYLNGRNGTCNQLLAACASDSARARQLVDSLKAAGADMIKLRAVTRDAYFAAAAEARRMGIPFVGHVEQVTEIEASDSGARIIDHLGSTGLGGLATLCLANASASVEQCRPIAEHLKHQGTWVEVDDAYGLQKDTYVGNAWVVNVKNFWGHFTQRMHEFWAGSPLPSNWLRDSALVGADSMVNERLTGSLSVIQRAGLPIVAGTDATPIAPWRNVPLGFMLHGLLAKYVAAGMTPLAALQTATLNPAQLLHATDSLGTVAPGKLADLVLLDADPLADITNTTTIRAVVANGRYFDRAALDQLLTDVRAKAKQEP